MFSTHELAEVVMRTSAKHLGRAVDDRTVVALNEIPDRCDGKA